MLNAPVHPQTLWLPPKSKLVVGSRNPDKLLEYGDLLGELNFEIMNLKQLEIILGLPDHTLGDVPEPGLTYEENARIKNLAIAEAIMKSSIPNKEEYVILTDDSGIEAGQAKWSRLSPDDLRKSDAELLLERKSDRLHGLPYPGVDTAYVEKAAGPTENIHACYQAAIEANGGDRSMRAITVIAAMTLSDENVRYFRGEVRERLAEQSRGTTGFGYDFCFEPNGSDKTYAEMSKAEKLRISERRLALTALIDSLRGSYGPPNRGAVPLVG